MAGRLGEFLEAAGRGGFEWGARDCLLFAADWCVANGRADPAAAYRGRYRSERGALRLLRGAGGIEALAGVEMARAGFAPCTAPKTGDVGLVSLPGAPDGLCIGAIWTGSLWAMVTKGGLLLLPLTSSRIWSV